jgi:hypothetical protein
MPISVVTEARRVKLFRKVAPVGSKPVYLGFQKLVPLQKYYPGTGDDWTEKSQFLTLKLPPFELGA